MAVKHYAGLDVSMRETSIYVVDETRKVVREGEVGSEPRRSRPGYPRLVYTSSGSVSRLARLGRQCATGP